MAPDSARVRLRDAAADLLLGGSCVGCAAPGRLLCPGCRDALPVTPFACPTDPPLPGLVTPWAAAVYDGVVRDLVVGHKERRLLALTPVLGGLLARAVAGALDASAARPGAPVVLVPVPSRAATRRARGHDPTLALVRTAARLLTRCGATASVAPLLRSRPGVVDQAGLDARERQANVDGSMAAAAAGVRRLARRTGRAHVVVCDDVHTTGSTAREAQRALASAGVPVLAVAVVAATPRRPQPGRPPALLGDSSGAEVPRPRPIE